MTIRWGFLGAGYVASRAMAPAVHAAHGAQLSGVASRDIDRSRSLEPEKVYDSYPELIASSDIDAVYISLTNGQHLHWVIEALTAGKNVLCEKPLGLNAPEVDAMREAAVRAGTSVVEAVWVRWHPRFRRFVEIVRSGELGEALRFRSAFTFSSDMEGNYRLRPEWGGGALLDVGCYQAHTWIAAMGSETGVRIRGVERVVGPTGVDLTTKATVELGGSATGEMQCSFVESPSQMLVAEGENSLVEMSAGEAFTSWREPSSLTVGGIVEVFPEIDAFVVMVEQVSRQFANEEPALFDVGESHAVARVLDGIAAAVQT